MKYTIELDARQNDRLIAVKRLSPLTVEAILHDIVVAALDEYAAIFNNGTADLTQELPFGVDSTPDVEPVAETPDEPEHTELPPGWALKNVKCRECGGFYSTMGFGNHRRTCVGILDHAHADPRTTPSPAEINFAWRHQEELEKSQHRSSIDHEGKVYCNVYAAARECWESDGTLRRLAEKGLIGSAQVKANPRSKRTFLYLLAEDIRWKVPILMQDGQITEAWKKYKDGTVEAPA